jgi:hypothetical protein
MAAGAAALTGGAGGAGGAGAAGAAGGGARGWWWTEGSACDEESEGYATALPTLVMSSSVPT